MTGKRLTVLAPLGILALTLLACAVNPATGKRQLMLFSESQEIAMGREADPGVVAQFGLYPDEELQAYVEQLGKRLAARSERPQLPWTFRVLDDPLVNAFALPGGYIYVTRGILAHFNNEAELVSVLGHEIGHVTARHSMNQMSKAQAAQLGLGAGALLAPERMDQFGGLAQSGLGLLFLKFGRDDERQADDLGLRYVVGSGYDPRPMADVFVTLRRVGQSSGGSGAPGWLSTHPDPEDREGRVHSAIATMSHDLSGTAIRRAEFLDRIDGIVFGDDPRQGFFDGATFHHPEMAFRIRLPEGWDYRNSRQAVSASSSEQDAIVRLSLAEKKTAAQALEAFLGQEGIDRAGDWRPATTEVVTGGEFRATAGQTPIRGRVVYVEHEGRVFELLGFSIDTKWGAYVDGATRALTSFGRETDRRVLDVRPRRLRVVRADASMNLERLAQRFDVTVDTTTLARINGVEPDARLEAGASYKVVQGGELP